MDGYRSNSAILGGNWRDYDRGASRSEAGFHVGLSLAGSDAYDAEKTLGPQTVIVESTGVIDEPFRHA